MDCRFRTKGSRFERGGGRSWRWALRFLYMYILKRGFLDGIAGLDMCLFMTRDELEISRRFRVLMEEAK
jgi:hypothetical protein